MIGEILAGRYEITAQLAEGGVGKTFLAADTQRPNNPTCVVKQLHLTSYPPVQRLFQTEAEILESLGKHPQIPQLLAYFQESENFYLVQEYIAGHALTDELVPGEPLPEAQVVNLLLELLELLEFVHERNVIHRDIKPDNIIRRDADNKLVLIDFGAVKLLSTRTNPTTTIAIGTPGYMPIEQICGKPRLSSDVYAVGMIAIGAIAGIHPTRLPEDPDTSEIVWRNEARVSPELAEVLETMVRQDYQQRYPSAKEALQAVKGFAPSHPKWRQDWGDAQDVSVFYGRTSELATLEQWIVNQGCRLVAIVGMGGIGKTDLSLKLARGIQDNFEYVIWRSLLNGPPVINILADWIKFLSNQQEIDLPHTLDGQISRLLHYLRQHPCLLILDNAETILQGGDRAGQYREGYEEYGQLFESIGLVSHESCLLLTTREKPREIRRMPGQKPPVRSLELKGLDFYEGREFFTEMGDFSGLDGEWRELIEFYNGNPLALELAANHIAEVFGGNISEFLREGQPVFGDVRDLLDWHFHRFSDREKEIIYWLAINRESVSLVELKEDILSPVAKQQVPETLQSLQRRWPLEYSPQGFKLQPVLIEYVTDRLIERVSEEMRTKNLELFNSDGLLKATAKDYVREFQVRMIMMPVATRLVNAEKELRLFPIKDAKMIANLPEILSQ